MKRVMYPLVAFFAPFTLYCFTLAPTFLWSDSSKLALRVFHREVYTFSHGHHPFHTLSFWLYSVITETYTIHAFFLVLLLLLTQAYCKTSRTILFSSLFFCLGLALYNHSSAVLFVLPLSILAFTRTPFRWRTVLTAAMAFALGISPIFLLPALKFGIADALNMFFQDTGGHVVTFVDIKKITQEWWKIPLFLGYQFPSLAFFAGYLGFSELRKRDAAFHWTISAIFVLNTGLALIYFLQRQFALLISSYLIFGVWIAAGLEHRLFETLWGTRRRLKLLSLISMFLLPLLVYYNFPDLYKKSGLNLIRIRDLPYRDSISYFFTPDKRTVTGARAYAEEVFGLVDEGALIVGDFNPGMALKYYQEIEGARPDVSLILPVDQIYFSSPDPAQSLAEILERNQERSVYLADSYEPYYYVPQLERYLTLRRLGPSLKVEPKF